jgi:outer membrane protein assembly factor BamD
MDKQIVKILFITLLAYLFVGCSSKEENKYNKPAIFWYNKMIKEISSYQIDKADDTFTSLESEHRNSPLLPSAIMIIANAHMDDEEYAMANYYFDQYLKKYSYKKNTDYIKFLKIKSNFLAFSNQYREQNLLDETLKQTNIFIKRYPKSEFLYLVEDIKSRLLMTKGLFDKEIASLYERIDKPKAAEFYNKKAETTWKDSKNTKDIYVPWHRYIFE